LTAPRRGTALRRFGPYVAAVAIAVAAVAGLMWRPTPIAPTHRADYVVLAGAAGLRWDDIDPVGTPTLWELASNHAIAALSVRSAHRPTCPADGWLTLGAGNFALWDTAAAEDRCPPVNPRLTSPDGIGAKLVDLTTVNGHNRDLYGAQPGALAEAVRCTAAVGPGARPNIGMVGPCRDNSSRRSYQTDNSHSCTDRFWETRKKGACSDHDRPEHESDPVGR
jgi:hypothetical protein